MYTNTYILLYRQYVYYYIYCTIRLYKQYTYYDIPIFYYTSSMYTIYTKRTFCIQLLFDFRELKENACVSQHLGVEYEFRDEKQHTIRPKAQRICVQNVLPIGQKLLICIINTIQAFDSLISQDIVIIFIAIIYNIACM